MRAPSSVLGLQQQGEEVALVGAVGAALVNEAVDDFVKPADRARAVNCAASANWPVEGWCFENGR